VVPEVTGVAVHTTDNSVDQVAGELVFLLMELQVPEPLMRVTPAVYQSAKRMLVEAVVLLVVEEDILEPHNLVVRELQKDHQRSIIGPLVQVQQH
jgi:hypothetical protein